VAAAAIMLRHLGETEPADAVEGATLATLAQGVRTRDVAGDAGAAGTIAFTDAVIANLGASAMVAPARQRRPLSLPPPPKRIAPAERRLVGMDLFIEATVTAQEIGRTLEELVEGTPLRLKMISNRGTKVYPPTGAMTDCVDHWRCRLVFREEIFTPTDDDLVETITRVGRVYRWMHVEKLKELDGAPGYTRAQGED